MSSLKKIVEFVIEPSIKIALLTAISVVIGGLITYFSSLNVWWGVAIISILRALMQAINTKFNIGGRVLGGLGMTKK
jgi:hypothetical protein